MSNPPFHVAIIGGGLCGLSLAIALTKRSISHTIYEARASFTEIGAGINLGPNTIEAFKLIDSDIGDAIFSLATRNPGRKKDLWMDCRLGAPTDDFEDAKLIYQITTAPLPIGTMTVSRNELLQFLAQRTKPENARYNKKLVDLKHSDDDVTLTFDDGSRDTASVVIGCDGAHSVVRRLLLGPDNPATSAKFAQTGVYRAVFPIEKFEKLLGKDQAGVSTVRLGPGGYVIHYPIDGGKNINVGLWPGNKEVWEHEAWVIPNQKSQMVEDFKAWGPTVQGLIKEMSDETAFWATFTHSVPPESYFEGRVCIIGDSAHSMGPHQGQGASQSMEDACVMAEVLQAASSASAGTAAQQVQAAFAGYEHVRKPRFEKALRTSNEAFSFWGDLWKSKLSEADLEAFAKQADERFPWLWHPDIAGQGRRALAEMNRRLNGNADA
ncbi:uncharacterized protein LTR77_010825 [Saxophila tyrrhenica]|uniref:FAD-binding domain-containing protein n=1 Tax=Saxophila tyrrhenica TaxID=1690608 RepID=A0AAV9NV84_9PEZI|nr:hypothetical protein LTR77_010825 [Saxophila tyrrhenica]